MRASRHGVFTVAFAASVQAATVPYFPAANDPSLQGFVRVINHSDQSGEVYLQATDDLGTTYDPVTLTISAGQTAPFNSDDLELGNEAKGLSHGIGAGQQ